MKYIKKFEGFDDHGLGSLSGMDHPGSLRGWEKANDNPYEGYYIIGWGLSGGFGGIQNYEVIIEDSIEKAESEAYQRAIEEYSTYEGMHGLRSVSDIMEEDGIDDEEEAESIYNEERESWLDYSAKPYSKEYEKKVKNYHYENRYSDKLNESIDSQIKNEIDKMSHEELASLWRFGDSSDKRLQGEEGKYLKDRLFNHFGGFNSNLSKRIGW